MGIVGFWYSFQPIGCDRKYDPMVVGRGRIEKGMPNVPADGVEKRFTKYGETPPATHRKARTKSLS